MKVLQINSFGNLSTGRIAVDIYRTLKEENCEGIIAFSRNTIAEDVESIKFGTNIGVYIDGFFTRLTDKAGFYSRGATNQLIKKIVEYNPDIIHLHNIHGYYINIAILFKFLKTIDKPVIWTLHDCWSFTGHCCNFEASNCEKWKSGCNNCRHTELYPSSIIDNSKWNYRKKRELFTSLNNLTLVTPSMWLFRLVKESYLSDCDMVVIHNGFDNNIFKPTQGNWRKRSYLENKKIILGVAGTWTSTKGLNDLIEISKRMDDRYKVVVVGVTDDQIKKLPHSIVGIKRTYNSAELAEIYTEADFFVNPTYDDNFPNVNLEALACGTPVITYNTGGSPEAINNDCGRVVKKGDIDEIIRIINTEQFLSESCIKRASCFTRKQSYSKYVDLYRKIMSMKE